MGVPKFFRYISERYPCLSEVIKEYQIPEFDNLYLDMNGIIHSCSHPNDGDPHFRISEEEIFKQIFHYTESLFRMIQPKKLFFMSVDGVAPRAKMNQQRGRRFRSAKDADVMEKRALLKGETLPEDKRFDSNCITPGTVFMARLQEQLKYFVSYKISTDKIWQRPQIILSGHETPGEGEHKIMDYIRFLRSQRGWDPNTRHCLYGADADLILLGMSTHEPHFSLLREEVKFGKHQKRIVLPEETNFYLLHLSLLRDYLDLEFTVLKKTLPFSYDLEKIIDDWILLSFLVGNDFIPNLPGLNIADGALHLLYNIYIEVLPKLGGYLNESGNLNLVRFEAYLQRLSQFDIDQFKENYADLKYFESKTGRKMIHEDSLSFDLESANEDLKSLIESTNSALETRDDSGDESDVDTNSDDDLMTEFSLFKRDYYMNKLDYGQVTMEILTSQAEGYVRAIQWNLHYYYHGCPSWVWFYPHHYAPYISDIKGFSDLKLEFDLGQPFLPFQQLLSVLPAASKDFLPEPLQKLLVSEDSPIIDFFPKDFQIDMNGKKQEWEGIVLIPFIDQDTVVAAMEPCYEQMTDEEKRRNSHGPMNMYKFTSDDLGCYDAPEYFPRIKSNHAKCKKVWTAEICVESDDLVKGLYPGVSESYMLGFPTLRHVPFTSVLQKSKVRVFESPSRGDNMILIVSKQDPVDLEETAERMLGKTVLVNWPHLLQARVSAITTSKLGYTFDRDEDIVCTPMSFSDSNSWNLTKTGIISKHKTRMGIEFGSFEVIVWAHPLQGTKLKFDSDSSASISMVWCKEPVAYPYQTTLSDVAMYKTVSPVPRRLEEVFPVGSTCFMLAEPKYGSLGTVLEGSREGRIKLSLIINSDPDLSSVQQVLNNKKRYLLGGVACQRIGIGRHLFSRITGTIFIQSAHTEADKVNIGLNLKFNKRNEELTGFTKKDGMQWYYSQEVLDLVNNYMLKFPELFEYLSRNTGDDIFFKDNVFPVNANEKVKEIIAWLKDQPHFNAPRRSVGAEIVEEEGVKEIERVLKGFKARKIRKLVVHVVPYLLYQAKTYLGQIEPDPEAEHLILDRIINVRECHSIPLGLKGIIIGIDKKDTRDGTIYEIIFDEEFVGGLRLGTEDARCYRLTRQAFINISFGVRTKRATLESLPVTGASFVPKMDPNRNSSAFANWRNRNSHGTAEAPDFFPDFQGVQGTSHQKQPMPKATADSEFQAMWSVLQRQKIDTSKSPQQVNNREYTNPMMAVSQQTDALKKFLRLDNGTQSKLRPEVSSKVGPAKKSCGHGKCTTTLITLCQKMGVPYPTYTYTPNMMTKQIVCTIRFPGIMREVVGQPEAEKSQAAENAACLGIQLLEQVAPQPFMQGTSGFYPPPPGFHRPSSSASRGQSHLNQNLPTPPQQWYQQNNKNATDGSHQKWGQRDVHPTHVNGGKPSGINQFLPLQVQKSSPKYGTPSSKQDPIQPSALHQSPVEEASKESAPVSVVSSRQTSPRSRSSEESSGQKRARPKPRIAAKFPVPIAKQ